MKTQKTLAEIATILNKKVWTAPNGQERIYFNEVGYNTRKMATKAYIYIVDGEVKESIFVTCANQPTSWCVGQAKQLGGKMISKVERALEVAENPEKFEHLPYSGSVARAIAPKKVFVPEKIEVCKKFAGEKYEHSRFGIGVKIEETKDTIKLFFQGFGEKNLLKKFAKLKLVA